jgi:hypothetical protein
MFRNRMLGGASFLPLFAADGAGAGAGAGEADPAEVAAHGDPEFAEAPEGEAANEAQAGDAAAEGGEGEAPADSDAAAAGAAAGESDDDKPKTPEELAAALAHSQRAVKALTGRLVATSADKRRLSEQLQATIKPVAAAAQEPAAGEGEQPVIRTDFKTQAEFDAAVKAEAVRVATQQLAVEAWNSKCNAVEDAGSKAFGAKWQEAKNQLAILDDEGRIPADLLATALETDNPAQVLFALGNNLDKATELLAISPARRAIAMDRMAQAKPPERQRSKAPPPIDPINGNGGGNDAPSDRDSDEEWHRKEGLREAERRKKRLGLA